MTFSICLELGTSISCAVEDQKVAKNWKIILDNDELHRDQAHCLQDWLATMRQSSRKLSHFVININDLFLKVVYQKQWGYYFGDWVFHWLVETDHNIFPSVDNRLVICSNLMTFDQRWDLSNRALILLARVPLVTGDITWWKLPSL